MEDQSDVDAAIAALKETSVSRAVGSIDYGINATAIAVQAPEVIDRLRSVLSKGYRLKAIQPITGSGSSLMDFRLRFRFHSDDIIDVGIEDFVVSVELPTKTVNRILDPGETIQPAAVPVPFVLAVPSQAPQTMTSATELDDNRRRAQLFFRRRQLGHLISPGVVITPDPTVWNTQGQWDVQIDEGIPDNDYNPSTGSNEFCRPQEIGHAPKSSLEQQQTPVNTVVDDAIPTTTSTITDTQGVADTQIDFHTDHYAGYVIDYQSG